jgi:NTP pyrophosphatase (non-canonical NTP hydrolase)
VVVSQTEERNYVMEPTNHDRAAWASNALESFRRETQCDYEDSLSDLLCDLMHFANLYDCDFEAALMRARRHHQKEIYEVRSA